MIKTTYVSNIAIRIVSIIPNIQSKGVGGPSPLYWLRQIFIRNFVNICKGGLLGEESGGWLYYQVKIKKVEILSF